MLVSTADYRSSRKGVEMPKTVPLSDRTRKLMHMVFNEENWDRIEQTLVEDCGPPDVYMGSVDNLNGIERIRIAAVKVSKGNLQHFEYCIRQARTDWRDLLMNAGFGSDLSAHLHWSPEEC